MTAKAIFFDRDGTLIVDKVYLNDPEQIEYLPDVFSSLRRLRDNGYRFVVVTNQSGIARGLVEIDNLHEIHRRMQEEFAREGIFFAGFYYAPYSGDSRHPMRKPNPGMLLTAANEHNLDLTASWMVGDRMSDVEAGRRAGTRTILLAGEDAPELSEFEAPTGFVANLKSMADFILCNDTHRNEPAHSKTAQHGCEACRSFQFDYKAGQN